MHLLFNKLHLSFVNYKDNKLGIHFARLKDLNSQSKFNDQLSRTYIHQPAFDRDFTSWKTWKTYCYIYFNMVVAKKKSYKPPMNKFRPY